MKTTNNENKTNLKKDYLTFLKVFNQFENAFNTNNHIEKENTLSNINYLLSDLFYYDDEKTKYNELLNNINSDFESYKNKCFEIALRLEHPSFWGVKLNDEEIKNKRLSYYTLAKQFDAVLCNNITSVDEFLYDNIESGDLEYCYFNDDYLTREEVESLIEEKENILNNDDLSEEEKNTLEEEINELENADFYYEDIFQYFIIDYNGAELLKHCKEIVFYSDKLDCYVWGVTHFGTSWDYVMTNLKLNDDFTSIINW